jgi:thioredoxin 1
MQRWGYRSSSYGKIYRKPEVNDQPYFAGLFSSVRFKEKKRAMAVSIKETNGAEIDALIMNGKTLADFYSKECGPCKMLSYVLNDVAKELDGVEIIKIDFNANKEAVEKYGVSGYPTLILFDNGQEIKRLEGLQQKPVVMQMVSNNIRQ